LGSILAGLLVSWGAWSGVLSDAEIDEFVRDIYEARDRDLGRPVDLPDCLLDTDILSNLMRSAPSTTLLDRGLTVVTGNTRHFSRIPGLAVENWPK